MTPFEFDKEPIDTPFDEYCERKAKELFSEKESDVRYKVSGAIGAESKYEYYWMTDDVIEVIKKLQEQNPGEDISYLLETSGHEDIKREFDGEDDFWVYTIDWTPRKLYRFSIIESSQFSYKPEPRQEVYIHLENEEYIQLLCSRIMAKDYNFNSLVTGCPELAQKIMTQLIGEDEPYGKHLKPFALFMDEVEEDVKKILGAPIFDKDVYSVNGGDIEEISFMVSEDNVELYHSRNDECEMINVATGYMSSYMENTELLTDISFTEISQIYDEADPEILVNKLAEDFCGENAFEKFKAFLDDKKIPYTHKKDKMLV